MKLVEIPLEDHMLQFEVEGDVTVGDPELILEGDDNIISATAWADQGYTVKPFLSQTEYDQLQAAITRLFHELLKKHNLIGEENFQLVDYHHYVNTDESHLQLIKETMRGFPLDRLPFEVTRIEQRISEIVSTPVTLRTSTDVVERFFFVRAARPKSQCDGNPPHRDVWLDYLRHAVNIYAPIAGSTDKSALPVVAGSHLWKESEIERTVKGAKINGIEYHVASVTALKQGYKLTRPNPKENEVMLFSPYIIHGGGINLNDDETRFSLEMRFWRTPQLS
jgi:ectoine hydroxylase-related dioxygenase (phytanoyl-CoA dioxygenase family)